MLAQLTRTLRRLDILASGEIMSASHLIAELLMNFADPLGRPPRASAVDGHAAPASAMAAAAEVARVAAQDRAAMRLLELRAAAMATDDDVATAASAAAPLPGEARDGFEPLWAREGEDELSESPMPLSEVFADGVDADEDASLRRSCMLASNAWHARAWLDRIATALEEMLPAHSEQRAIVSEVHPHSLPSPPTP